MRSANIKNLSIALEALSRFPSEATAFGAVGMLLAKEIELMQEEQHPPLTYKPTRTPIDTTDEIPF